jgi:hypothetical protein
MAVDGEPLEVGDGENVADKMQKRVMGLKV